MTHCCSTTTPRKPMGYKLEITCVVRPGRGRIKTSGQAQSEHWSSCKNAIDWLSDWGGQQIEKRGIGKPRFDASTLLKDFDVSGGEAGTSQMPWSLLIKLLRSGKLLTLWPVHVSGALPLLGVHGGQEGVAPTLGHLPRCRVHAHGLGHEAYGEL